MQELHLSNAYMLSAEELASSLSEGVKLRFLRLNGCQNLKVQTLIDERPDLFDKGCTVEIADSHLTALSAACIVYAAVRLNQQVLRPTRGSIQIRFIRSYRCYFGIIPLLNQLGVESSLDITDTDLQIRARLLENVADSCTLVIFSRF